jgi:N-acetyl-D-muramate 6-phosphate phosphatase
VSLTLRAILFDLDGTFIDSAEDLANAMNAVRKERGEPVVPLAQLRPHTAKGASSMIAQAYGYDATHTEYGILRERFLAHYANSLLNTTKIWPGMAKVASALNARNIPWGIVTNKATRFALPVVAGLQIAPRVLVCGDTTPKRKPDPEPLLHAAEQMAIPATQIAYVGDAKTDMQAARAAGMYAVGAGYSDFVVGLSREDWGAHVWVDSPAALLSLPFAS